MFIGVPSGNNASVRILEQMGFTDYSPENKPSNFKVNNQLATLATDPSNGSSPLERNVKTVVHAAQDQTAYVSHIRTGEPCHNKCGLASEWQIEHDPDVRLCFCNGCFSKAKKDFESSGFRVESKMGIHARPDRHNRIEDCSIDAHRKSNKHFEK